MKRIVVKNKGKKLGVVYYDYNDIYKNSLKLTSKEKKVSYRDIEPYYDAIRYIPYPNQTLKGIVMSYEEDVEKQDKIIKKIKHKNNIEEITPFREIRLYGVPLSHLKDFGYTAKLSETKSIKFINDVHKFISDNKKFIIRTDNNSFDVDILNDEINDLNRIYENFLDTNDKNVKDYLYPHLRDGYLEILDRFKKLTGRDFFFESRVYPIN